MRKQTPAHYLRRNHSEWTPPCLVTFDTETRSRQADRDTHTLRCWVASRILRPNGETDWGSQETASGFTADLLAKTVDMWSARATTLWMYAHNLSFDLTVTRLPLEMTSLGWTVTDFALDGRSPWMRLTKGRKHITIADSFSWVPTSLDAIASALGTNKLELPRQDDSDADWIARCRRDVDILSSAMTTLMDWWSQNGCGRWSITGAASGWNAFRHIDTPHRMVIDVDPDGIAVDRAAIYGGKRFVNKVGSLPPGKYIECDFARAYTTIAKHMPVPIRRCRPFDSLDLNNVRLHSDRWGIIATVNVDTDVPRYPKRHRGRVWYPIGRFTTVLAGPEIKRGVELGHIKSIGPGYTYKLAPALRPWAKWCLNLVDGKGDSTPTLVRMTAKGWGRSVVGKFAQHGYQRTELGPAPSVGWGYGEAWMADTHTRASIVDLAGRRYMCTQEGDGDNAFPAVLAYVESYVRTLLNDVIDLIGQNAFIQCDTDGLLLSSADLIGAIRRRDTFTTARTENRDIVDVILDRISEYTWPLRLVRKSSYTNVQIIGPQHIVIDGHYRMAGVPGRAEPVAEGTLGAWTWPGMSYQLRHGDPGGFVRVFQTYRVPRNLAAGWVDMRGSVHPVEMATDDRGHETILPWEQSRYGASVTLDSNQSDAIMAAMTQVRGA